MSKLWLKDENNIHIRDEDGNRINNGNGIFDIMVESPVSMKFLTETGWLSPIKYYGVPIKGIEGLKMAQGEYKPGEVEKTDAQSDRPKRPESEKCRNLKTHGRYGIPVRPMNQRK